MKFEKAQLADICKRYGPFLVGLPAELNGQVLLWAIAGNESSFGQDCAPRHEAEYCPQMAWHQHVTADAQPQMIRRAGKYSNDPRQPELHREYGCLACCSLTPWQIMAVHAIGYSPVELLTELEHAAEAIVRFLNRKIQSVQPTKLSHFATIWNGGGVSQQYIEQLQKNYAQGLE